jgi:hypothetical protein
MDIQRKGNKGISEEGVANVIKPCNYASGRSDYQP